MYRSHGYTFGSKKKGRDTRRTEEPYGQDDDDRGEGDLRRGAVICGDGVYDARHDEERDGEDGRGQEDVPRPLVSSELPVQTARRVARDACTVNISQSPKSLLCDIIFQQQEVPAVRA